MCLYLDKDYDGYRSLLFIYMCEIFGNKGYPITYYVYIFNMSINTVKLYVFLQFISIAYCYVAHTIDTHCTYSTKSYIYIYILYLVISPRLRVTRFTPSLW